MFKKLSLGFLALGLMLLAGCSPTGGKTSILNVDEVATKAPMTDYISYEGEDGKTVLELLERISKVEAETVEGGTIVNSIDGVTWDYVNNKNWFYLVNGQPQDVLADKYVTKNGDKVEWKYGNLGQ